jgi:hypothetical protein
MNTKRILSYSGTLMLAAVAVLAGRATTKFVSNPATKLYYTKAGVCQGFNLAGSTFTGTTSLTTGGTGNPAFIATVTGTTTTKYAIFNTSTCQSAHRIRANAF